MREYLSPIKNVATKAYNTMRNGYEGLYLLAVPLSTGTDIKFTINPLFAVAEFGGGTGWGYTDEWARQKHPTARKVAYGAAGTALLALIADAVLNPRPESPLIGMYSTGQSWVDFISFVIGWFTGKSIRKKQQVEKCLKEDEL